VNKRLNQKIKSLSNFIDFHFVCAQNTMINFIKSLRFFLFFDKTLLFHSKEQQPGFLTLILEVNMSTFKNHLLQVQSLIYFNSTFLSKHRHWHFPNIA